MSRIDSRALLLSALFIAGSALTGCGSSQSGGANTAPAKGGGSGIAAPPWFHNRPKSPSSLFFVGDVNGASDESTARELAVQKALAELTVYCGATVKSDFSALDRESNGKSEQVVSMTVDVAGDELTVREAVVKQTVVGKRTDGSYDAYALIEWPRTEYDNVLAMQRDRGRRALELFLKADGAADDNDTLAAKATLREAKATLGPMKSQVPLEHAVYKNTALLYDAMSALQVRLENSEKEKKTVFAVAVECIRDGQATPCRASRPGALRESMSKVGRKVSAESVPASVAQNILSSENPTIDRGVRTAGYIVAVRYTSELVEVSGPFTFVRCGARGVIFDTGSNRIVGVHEIEPEKEGHPKYEGAMEKGWTTAETKLKKWLEEQIPTIK